MNRVRLLPLGWVLTAWQRCPEALGETPHSQSQKNAILFQGVPPLPLTSFPSPDVGPTTYKEEAGSCLNVEKPTSRG